MIRLGRLILVLALATPLLAFSGCKQGVGERCQVDSDCDDNLRCNIPAGGSVQSGGTCQAPVQSVTDMSANPGSSD